MPPVPSPRPLPRSNKPQPSVPHPDDDVDLGKQPKTRAGREQVDADEIGKFTREEVAYGNPPPKDPYQTCSACEHYNNAYRCELVMGDINPTRWCLEWVDAKTPEQMPGRRPEPSKIETTTAMSIGTGPDMVLGAHSSARGGARTSPHDPKVPKGQRAPKKRRRGRRQR